MSSTNHNQKEEHEEDLSGFEAGKRIQLMAEEAKSCFFCTESGVSGKEGVRPMSVSKADEDGTLWFLSDKNSVKNRDISINKQVRLYFQGSAHSDFLHLTGEAEILYNQEKIRELWTPIAKDWFTEGVEDPRISVIKVIPKKGLYWDNKHGNALAGVTMLIGAAIGKRMDDSIHGSLSL